MPGVVGYQGFVWGFYASWLHFDLVCLYGLTPNVSDDISVFFCLLKAKIKKNIMGCLICAVLALLLYKINHFFFFFFLFHY